MPKPFIPNCYRCDFTIIEIASYGNNEIWLSLIAVLSISGTFLIAWQWKHPLVLGEG
jgi:hypothetical protein